MVVTSQCSRVKGSSPIEEPNCNASGLSQRLSSTVTDTQVTSDATTFLSKEEQEVLSQWQSAGGLLQRPGLRRAHSESEMALLLEERCMSQERERSPIHIHASATGPARFEANKSVTAGAHHTQRRKDARKVLLQRSSSETDLFKKRAGSGAKEHLLGGVRTNSKRRNGKLTPLRALAAQVMPAYCCCSSSSSSCSVSVLI